MGKESKIRTILQAAQNVVVQASIKSGQDSVPRHAAAFSFFAILSLAPVLVFAIVIAGNVFGQGAARDGLLEQVRQSIGPQGERFISELLTNANKPSSSFLATGISLSVTFFSASNLFAALDDSINSIWRLESKQPIVTGLLWARLTAFALVAVFGLLALGWVALDAWLAWLQNLRPDFKGWSWFSQGVSFLFLTLVFALMHKRLPRNLCKWSDVWWGAFFTAVGITLLRSILTLYFSIFNVSAVYGSAGALVVILLWIFYAAQIFFFGVEITYAYAHFIGSRKGLTSPPPSQ